MQLKLTALVLCVGVEHVQSQALQCEGLIVLVVVVINSAIQPGQTIQEAGLESKLVSIQGFRIKVHVLGRQSTVGKQCGIKRRIKAPCLHPAVVAGVQQRVVAEAIIQTQLGGEEIVFDGGLGITFKQRNPSPFKGPGADVRVATVFIAPVLANPQGILQCHGVGIGGLKQREVLVETGLLLLVGPAQTSGHGKGVGNIKFYLAKDRQGFGGCTEGAVKTKGQGKQFLGHSHAQFRVTANEPQHQGAESGLGETACGPAYKQVAFVV